MPRASVEQRFWAKVQGDDATSCWIWTGSRNRQGYGQLGVNGKYVRAHRWAYEQLRAPIDPDWLHIDHLCSNPPCVNPWHMEPVTHWINMWRAGKRGHSRTKTRPRVPVGVIAELPPDPPPGVIRDWDPGVYVALPSGEVTWFGTDEYTTGSVAE